MKKITFTLAVLASFAGFSQERTVTTSDYNEIEVSGSFTVNLVPGTEGKIALSGPQSSLEAAVVECKDGTLKIYTKRKARSGAITVTVPVTEISGVGLTGSGTITSAQTLKTDSFQTRLSGSGSITVKIDATKASSLSSGSGVTRISGTSEEFKGSISGSGDIHADELKCRNVAAYVSGSGNCNVYCDGELTAQIAGSGNVRYKGNTQNVQENIVGSET